MPSDEDIKTHKRSHPFCASLLYYLESGNKIFLSCTLMQIRSFCKMIFTNLVPYLQMTLMNVLLSLLSHSPWLLLSYIQLMILSSQPSRSWSFALASKTFIFPAIDEKRLFFLTVLSVSYAQLTACLPFTRVPHSNT